MSEEFTFMACRTGNAVARTPVFRRHDYRFCTVEYVLSGRGFLEVNGQSYAVGPDSIYILPKHSDHCYWPEKTDPWQKLFFVSDGVLIDRLMDFYGLTGVYCVPDCPELKNFFLRMYGLQERDPRRKGFLIAHQLFAALAEHLASPPGEAGTPVCMQLRQVLDRSIGKPFRLKEYARHAGVSEAHLIREFRRMVGTTPAAYLAGARMERARQLLRYSRLSVKEIAEELCFRDQYYFSNAFKRCNGVSPKIYRSRG